MGALLAVGISVMALLGWISIFKLVPACSISLMRHRLWRLRDQLVDEIRQGEYHDAVPAEILTFRAEAVIEHASKISMLNLALLRLSQKGAPELVDRLDLSMKSLSDDDRTRITAHLEEFETALFTRSMFGTPSGWIATLVSFPIFLVFFVRGIARALRGRQDGGSFTKLARDRIKAFDPDTVPVVGKRSDPQGLWHYV